MKNMKYLVVTEVGDLKKRNGRNQESALKFIAEDSRNGTKNIQFGCQDETD